MKFKRKSGLGVVWSGVILEVEIMKLINVPVERKCEISNIQIFHIFTNNNDNV